MLDSFRNMAHSFVAKIMLTILVLAFAVWGIGDMIRNPRGNPTVATVGSKTIGAREFQQALRGQVETARQMLGNNYSPELVKNLGLPQRAINQLIQKELISQESAALGLVPSDADVVRHIRTDSLFFDKNGNFDKAIFDARLKNSGVSEKAYIDDKRDDIARGLLMDTLADISTVSDEAVRTIYDTKEEQRNVTIYSLGASAVGDVGQPTDDQIQTYYHDHAHDFTVPEYRSVSYVTLNSSDVHNTVKVSDDDLKASYRERMDEFKHPERRDVSQLIYTAKDDAQKAAESLAGGKNFNQVAKETNVVNKTSVAMGKIGRDGVPESAADAVFALKANETTAPVDVDGTWRIYRVNAIEPPSVSPFEEVRATIEKDLKQKMGDDLQNKLANKLEDDMAGGATLAEAAKDTNLTVQSVGPFSHDGLDQDGNKVTLPTLDKFIDTSFKTDEKNASALVSSKGGLYYMVVVDKVIPERVRDLKDVKDKVVSGWQKEARAKKLDALAQQISKPFMAEKSRGDIITKYGLTVVANATVKHNSPKADDVALPQELVAEAFAHKAGDGTAAYLASNGNYLLAMVNTIIPAAAPAKDSKELADIRKALEDENKNELMSEYLYYLQTKYSVSINQAALQAYSQ